MNPRHYQRGWHCTSTIGTIGAAAAASRVFRLDSSATAHALAIAASEASGLKENFGTMVKPLHAGLAARNGVVAALLAREGMTASAAAIEGPQGFLTAMDGSAVAPSESDGATARARRNAKRKGGSLSSLSEVAEDLGTRWEILDTGITVKMYPSCAGTHPTIDALIDLQRSARFTAVDVEAIEIGVDPIVPTILIYDRPTSGLEGKFSMQFGAAAAVVRGYVGIDTFDPPALADPAIVALQNRVVMKVDPSLNPSAPSLTQAKIAVRLRDGRVLTACANGARGYPQRPASDEELSAKFLSCAVRVLPGGAARDLLSTLKSIDADAPLVRDLFSTP
jgi:2-methylcitrate dehydratase PrpD